MSNRSLVELNHDCCPNDDELLAYSLALQLYMRTGEKEHLPKGVTLKYMRHHSDPEPPLNLPSCSKCQRVCEHEAEIWGACRVCGNRTWNFSTYATNAAVSVPLKGF